MAIATEFMTTKLAALSGLDQRVGRILFDTGVLSEADFDRVVAAQREHGGRFSDAALRLGVVSERDVRRILAHLGEPTLRSVADKNPPSDKSPLSEKIQTADIGLALGKISRHITFIHQPDSQRAEALRSLRSELMLRWFVDGRVTLAIAEVRRNQGAAVLAANLACAFAQLGRRTLLIDANLRHPEQNGFFKMESAWGLADFLNGSCSLHEAIITVPGFDQLSVMFAGATPSNPQELLSLQSFGFMLEAVSDAFDVVLIVGSPILESADMQIVAARTTGSLVTARRHRTRVADLQRVGAYFASAGTALVGLVLEG